MHDAKTFERWTHTANIVCYLHNIQKTMDVLGTNKTAKFKMPQDFHPLMGDASPERMKLTKGNFSVLKMAGDAMVSR